MSGVLQPARFCFRSPAVSDIR